MNEVKINNKLISIIIPYYNRKEKLNRALHSIYSQTYQNFEIIVVDDYSSIPPDFNSYKFIYLKNEVNLGPGLSRNKGKRIAKGDYIVFLDSDDFFEKTFLEKCIDIAENNADFAFIYPKVGIIDENNKVISYRKEDLKSPKTIFPDILTLGRSWATSSCFWNSKIIKSIDWSEHRCWEDYLFDIKASLINNKVLFIDEVLVFYDSIGSDKLSKKDKDTQVVEKSKVIKEIFKILTSNDLIFNNKIQKKINYLIINSVYELFKHSSLSKIEIFKSIIYLNKLDFMKFSFLSLTMILPRNIILKILNKFRYI